MGKYYPANLVEFVVLALKFSLQHFFVSWSWKSIKSPTLQAHQIDFISKRVKCPSINGYIISWAFFFLSPQGRDAMNEEDCQHHPCHTFRMVLQFWAHQECGRDDEGIEYCLDNCSYYSFHCSIGFYIVGAQRGPPLEKTLLILLWVLWAPPHVK